jgi:quinolinate synthase
MNAEELPNKIFKVKKNLNAIILAHNYQSQDIQRAADLVGDSLELALAARDTSADILIVCGVTFMAETAKILNPGKRVFIPKIEAGCPLADFLTPHQIEEERRNHPDAAVVVYINSSAACKAAADIVCTSGNAVQVVRSLPHSRILFGPDSNLAGFVRKQLPDKEIIPIPATGHCYVHQSFTNEDILKARKIGGKIIAHPECTAPIQRAADIVASTGKMIKIIEESEEETWHVFTEEGMIFRLKTLFPNKTFYSYENAVCKDMRMTTSVDLLQCLQNLIGEVTVEEDVLQKARISLDLMLEASL